MKLITDETEKKALRDFYIREYKIKTGKRLVCIEDNGVRPNRCKTIVRANILTIAASYYGVETIQTNDRKEENVDRRRMTAALLKKVYRLTYEDIGELFKQERSTPINLLATFDGYYKVDRDYRKRYNKFKKYCTDKVQELYSRKSNKKLDDHKIAEIKLLCDNGEDRKEIAKKYNIHTDTVAKIANNRYKNKREKDYKKSK